MNARRFAAAALTLVFAIAPALARQQSSGTDAQTSAPSTSATQKPASRGTISGRVITDDGQPADGVPVTLFAAGTGFDNRRGDTDQDGKFAFDDLEPSSYSINVDMPGYVDADTSETRPPYRTGSVVTISMTKGGVITGTVLDVDDEPVIEIGVKAERIRDEKGRRVLAEYWGSSAATDDRGRYRIFGLVAGTYVVSAGSGNAYDRSSGLHTNESPVYYPSAKRVGATEITVRPGDEVSGIDIRYRAERGHTVSGTLSDIRQYGVSLLLARSEDGRNESVTYVNSRAGVGGFSFTGIPDGEYELLAEADDQTAPPRHVSVRGADVRNIALALISLGSVSGNVVVEEPAPTTPLEPCAKPDGRVVSESIVTLWRDMKGVRVRMPTDNPVSSNLVKRGGAFEVKYLKAGLYRLQTQLPSEDWYVRSITMGTPGAASPTAKSSAAKGTAKASTGTPAAARDASGGVALAGGQKLDGITVTVARGAAALRGTVQLAEGAAEGARLPAGLYAYLVPSEPDAAGTIVRYHNVAVSGGTFAFTNVAPGAYRVVVRAESVDLPADERRPAYWDTETRAALRAEAEARGAKVDLARCQRTEKFVARFAP